MCINMSIKCWVVSVFVILCAIEINGISTIILDYGLEHEYYKGETLLNAVLLTLKNASLYSWSYLTECWKHNVMTLGMLIADSIHTHTHTYIYIYIQGVPGGMDTKLRDSVPYVELYRYNPKHLYPKLNGYGDNGQRNLKLWQLLHTYWLPNTY